MYVFLYFKYAFMKSNKKFFSYPLFVIASISLLFLFFIVMVSYNSYFSWVHRALSSDVAIEIEKEIIFTDPFITTKSNIKNNGGQPLVSDSDPQRGVKNSKITIIEYSDFSCPHCYVQEKVFLDVLKKYTDKINFIRKDYPSQDKESLSWQLAKIGRCVFAQDKFWDFYDAFFSYSSIKEVPDIDSVLSNLSLDESMFKSCITSQEIEKDILKNIKEAVNLGVDGVPYFFINNKDYVGEMSFDELEKIIKFELRY